MWNICCLFSRILQMAPPTPLPWECDSLISTELSARYILYFALENWTENLISLKSRCFRNETAHISSVNWIIKWFNLVADRQDVTLTHCHTVTPWLLTDFMFLQWRLNISYRGNVTGFKVWMNINWACFVSFLWGDLNVSFCITDNHFDRILLLFLRWVGFWFIMQILRLCSIQTALCNVVAAAKRSIQFRFSSSLTWSITLIVEVLLRSQITQISLIKSLYSSWGVFHFIFCHHWILNGEWAESPLLLWVKSLKM